MPNNFSFMKYAEKSVPGLADVGVPHGDGDGPRTPPRWLEGVCKQFQMTNLTMPNKISFMKYAPKTVSGVADVGVPHGGKDGLPDLRPEGPDQKSTHTTLIRVKN